jgi:excisionase family DNA binding protein
MPTGKARTLLGMGERLWTERETADYLSIHVDTLRRMRRSKTGPPYVMVGTKPRYRPAEVEAWLDRRPEERHEGG